MIRSDALSLLRLMLGDQSSSVWSDTDLYSLLDRANLRTWRRILMGHPDVATAQVEWTYTADAESITLTTDNPIISVEKMFWKKGTNTFIGLPLRTITEMEELNAGSNSSYDLIDVMPHIAEGYYGVITQDYTTLLVRPVPSSSLTIRGYINLDLAEGALKVSTATDPNLLDGKFIPMHEAVVYDAGYLATFRDASLRQEFLSQREDIMALSLIQTMKEREAF